MSNGIVTVAIPVLNGAALLDEVLAAVRTQRVDGEIDLLVVDSGSTDGSIEIARRFDARLVEIPKSEYSHGGTRNLITELAQGDHVAFLTQDATPAHEDWLAALLDGFAEAPDVAAVFGPHLARADAPHMIARELQEHFKTWGGGTEIDVQRLDRDAEGLAEYRANPGRFTFLSSVNCCLARWAWQAMPYRDAPYAEDQLLGRELLEAGYAKVFTPRAEVFHSHRFPPITFMRRYFDEYRGLREVLGHREAADPRTVFGSVRRLVAADRAWLAARGAHGWKLRAATWSSWRHYLLRSLGAILGSRANRLPPWTRGLLSYEHRSTFEPFTTPRSPLLEDPVPWPRRPIHIDPVGEWGFVRERQAAAESRRVPHHGRPSGPLTIAWVVPPWGIGSGGHMTIFRLVRQLELRGNACAVFVFDPFGLEVRSAPVLREEIRQHFQPVEAPVFVGLEDFHSADVALATNWWTAYPVSDLANCLVKAYLVQDFEPSFYPMSAEYLWAEETYRMGLRCITFTPWLAQMMRDENGVAPAEFTYGTDLETYQFAPLVEREPGLVIVYARRETPRRGVELALAGLAALVGRRQGIRVVLFGSGAPATVPFPCEDIGVLSSEDLALLYRRATVGIALSLTNLSLVTLEMMASGLPVVELNSQNVTSILGDSGELAMLVDPHPDAIAAALETILDDPIGTTTMASRAREFVEKRSWARAGQELETRLREFLDEDDAPLDNGENDRHVPDMSLVAQAGVSGEQARELAQEIGRNWEDTTYYDQAEHEIDRLWDELIWPLIADSDFTVVVDLAAGHGRNTEKLREFARKVYAVDINPENIEFCRRRFAHDPRVEYLVCDGTSLRGIPDGEVTLVYSFDSMVHFDTDTIRAYLQDFRRVLRAGGRAVCHHSNYSENPTGDFRRNPHWRNFMSRELFEHLAHKEGLRVVRTRLVDWELPDLDCITVLESSRW